MSQQAVYQGTEAILLPELKEKIEAFYNAVDDASHGPTVYGGLWAKQTPIILVRNGVQLTGGIQGLYFISQQRISSHLCLFFCFPLLTIWYYG